MWFLSTKILSDDILQQAAEMTTESQSHREKLGAPLESCLRTVDSVFCRAETLAFRQPAHDLPTVPKHRLFSVPSQRRVRLCIHGARAKALAMSFLRSEISCIGGGGVILGLRALPALWEF